MALTRLGSLAATNLVLGGNVGTQGDAYKNYFLKGPISVASGITWTLSGSGTLEII